MSTTLERFRASLSFPLDDYQVQACRHLDEGAGVLVAAPTGAGKTVVGEYATELALERGSKCFYTTPIKALSNQKFHDLVARHGADQVGLLTGDVSVNSEAPLVVMTTEVLRNMIYARSRTLHGLGWVVMDEVHYLGDRFRGPVWEEVILGLDPQVRLVGLSATVSNAEEFGQWLDEVRHDVRVVVSERRPVPLDQHMAVRREVLDLFEPGGHDVNHELVELARQESRLHRDDARRPRGRSGRGRRTVTHGSGRFGGASAPRGARDSRQGPRLTPSRTQVVRALRRADLLPAIIFVFSRAGCDAAVRQLAGADIVLTSQSQARRLREIAERHGAQLSDEERRAIDWDHFVASFERGVAAHHAGLLPVVKAIVEEGFVKGLLKVVVATETLALGINMPARTVVIEKLVKYNGQAHVDLTPGEYTQLTGRAGRRGIDVEGHAVVCWQPGIDPRAVAGLASRRTYPLTSAFVPTYNMAVNLVATMGRDRARQLLEHSFAQFQIDRRVEATARRSSAGEEAAAVEEYLAAAHCERGDFTFYARLREEVSRAEAEQARLRRGGMVDEIADSLSALGPGDVFAVPAGDHRGWALVIDPDTRAGRRRGGRAVPRPLAMVEGRSVVRLGPDDLTAPVHRVAGLHVPRSFHPGDATARRRLGRQFEEVVAGLGEPPSPQAPRIDPQLAETVADLRRRIREHPCHSCPDRETHARFAERAMRLQRRHEEALTKARARSTSISTRFDRICLVLESLGYLEPGGQAVSQTGRTLARIYAELDLVLAEAVREGVLDGLDAPQLAAVLSTLVHESRPADRHRPARMPDRPSEAAESALRAVRASVARLERDHRLDPPRDLDIGFAWTAWAWASGAGLETVLDEGTGAGDFVRRIRQVADLAGQLSRAVDDEELARTCRQVVGALQRGVVAMDAEEA